MIARASARRIGQGHTGSDPVCSMKSSPAVPPAGRGEAHRAAVLLGLKEGVIEEDMAV